MNFSSGIRKGSDKPPVYVESAALYLPEDRLSVEELLEQGIVSPSMQDRLKKQGIRSVYEAKGLSGVDLICGALSRLMDKSNFQHDQLKLIIIVYHIPCFSADRSLIACIKERLDLPNIEGFTVRELHCATVMFGLEMSRDLLAHLSDPEDVAVVVAVSKHVMPFTRSDGVFLTGDGASALLISRNKGDRLLSINNTMDVRTLSESEGMTRWDISYLIGMKKNVHETLAKAHTAIEDIRLIVTNNAAAETWEYLSALLRISVDRFFMQGLYQFGFLFINDIIINYFLAHSSCRLKPGDKYMLLSLGSEGTSGCAIIEKG